MNEFQKTLAIALLVLLGAAAVWYFDLPEHLLVPLFHLIVRRL
jgi:hypothetical protein